MIVLDGVDGLKVKTVYALVLWEMNVFKSQATGLAICVAITVGTLLVHESLWYLGNIYWYLLELLAVVHVIVSGLVFIKKTSSNAIRVGVLALLIIGQWWAIEMFAVLAIWSLWGFAP